MWCFISVLLKVLDAAGVAGVQTAKALGVCVWGTSEPPRAHFVSSKGFCRAIVLARVQVQAYKGDERFLRK